jgi:class 3 adenylate cyclase
VTIRRRLTLGFVTILTLFAVSQGIQYWSATLRTRAMGTLDRVLKRQVLIGNARRQIGNLHLAMKQNSEVEGATPTTEFDKDIADAGKNIHELTMLSDANDRSEADQLEHTYATLADAWRTFFASLGVDEMKNVSAKLKAEPIGNKVLSEILPGMQAEQDGDVAKASQDFDAATRLANRLNIGIFVLSMLVSAAVAFTLARYLTSALSELSVGATRVGDMDLSHRIPVRSKDEIGTVAGAFNHMAENLATAQARLTREKEVSQSLLLNILPEQVASELGETGKFAPRYFEDVTILFTDFVGFTLATEKLAAEELVDVLHGYFTAFDQIVVRYQLEKMKTIGDSYFCAAGLPTRTPSHPIDALLAAMEMVHEVEQRTLPGDLHWRVRIGLHAGPVVAGVVGIKKFAFDIWGDTVNLASRMESGGSANRINVSETVYRRAKDFFTFEARGKVLTKEKKELEMFLLTGVQPKLMEGAGPNDTVPPAFAQRYRTYFSKEPVAFPRFIVTTEEPADS